MFGHDDDMKLRDGSRVSVVGAGPSGSIFASQLLRWARERRLALDVTLFDEKQFLREGPRGCNLCAGVICSGLLHDLADMGVELPLAHTQRLIEGYRFRMRVGELRMPRAAAHGSIAAVYRGNGPPSENPHAGISFDDLLLKHAMKLGAHFIPHRVVSVGLPPNRSGSAVVRFRSDTGAEPVETDLVVVACGVNSTFPARLEAMKFGYRRPVCRRACQAEIPLPNDFIDARFGSDILLLALGLERIRYVALVPKRGFITLTLIGYGDLKPDDLRSFMRHPELLAEMPPGWEYSARSCHCFPLIPVRHASGPATDRLVVIGDAAVSRYYKNGIGSAYVTATLAARAALDYGVSADALRRHFWLPAQRRIAHDNVSGRLLASASDFFTRNDFLSSVYLGACIRAPAHRAVRTFHLVNWNMITGDRPYRELVHAAASPAFGLELAKSAVRLLARRLVSLGQPLRPACPPPTRLGPLGGGETVAIVGGGPAGASCAISLKHLAAKRRIALNVLLYEAKDLDGEQQYNQCAGLLSPPIVEVMEQQLGVKFPSHLVQREITGYLFHGDRETISLPGEGQPSLALRRVQFDRYLAGEVVRRGVRIVHARVQDLEFNARGVRIFTDSGTQMADAVVGAFGLDSGTAAAFSRATPYRAPHCIETLITKLHPPIGQMVRHGGTVYAFLPPFDGVEFAAIIPKGNHLTLVMAGRKLRTEMMDRLLQWGPVREIVRPDECREQPPEYHKGRFPTSLARHIHGERYLTIGDAAGLVRPFKGKGVTTACQTGYLAATTMLDCGVGEDAMRHFYAECQHLTDDIFYGRIIRKLVHAARRAGAIDDLIRQAHRDAALRTAMYCCVSGEGTFQHLLAQTSGVRRGLRVAGAMLRGMCKRQPKLIAGTSVSR
jgi:flavin-dependent dehydrogenase